MLITTVDECKYLAKIEQLIKQALTHINQIENGFFKSYCMKNLRKMIRDCQGQNENHPSNTNVRFRFHLGFDSKFRSSMCPYFSDQTYFLRL